jgi:hypothetical protein
VLQGFFKVLSFHLSFDRSFEVQPTAAGLSSHAAQGPGHAWQPFRAKYEEADEGQ